MRHKIFQSILTLLVLSMLAGCSGQGDVAPTPTPPLGSNQEVTFKSWEIVDSDESMTGKAIALYFDYKPLADYGKKSFNFHGQLDVWQGDRGKDGIWLVKPNSYIEEAANADEFVEVNQVTPVCSVRKLLDLTTPVNFEIQTATGPLAMTIDILEDPSLAAAAGQQQQAQQAADELRQQLMDEYLPMEEKIIGSEFEADIQKKREALMWQIENWLTTGLDSEQVAGELQKIADDFTQYKLSKIPDLYE